MIHSQNEKELWIGLVELRVTPHSTALKASRGAFVDIVTWAGRPEQFQKNAEEVLGELGLAVVAVENCEPLSVRRTKLAAEGRDLSEELQDMVERATYNPKAIIYGTFHTWGRRAGPE